MLTELTVATRRNASLFARRRHDLARYVIGIHVCSLGVALAIESGLGAAPYDAVLTGLSALTSIPFWLTAWMLTAVWIIVVKALDGSVSLSQIVHGALFGPIIEVFLWILPAPKSLPIGVLYGLTGVMSLGVGIHLFLSARLLSGVIDTLFETVSTRFAIGRNRVRWGFDLFSLVAGVALGGAIGPLTIIVAVAVAPILAVLHTFDGRRAAVKSWRGIRLAD